MEAGASIPRSANPLLFNLTMGAVPRLAVLVDDEPLLSASIDRLLLDQKTDAKVGSEEEEDSTGFMTTAPRTNAA